MQKKPQLLRQKNDEYVIVDGTRTLQLLYNLYYWYAAQIERFKFTSLLIRSFQVYERCSIIDNHHDISGEGGWLLGRLYVVYSLSVHLHHSLGALGRATRYVNTRLLDSSMSLLTRRPLVKVEPQGNNLPQAVEVARCAVRSGWKLENAKQSYQIVHSGETVPWSDKFVDELKRGLLACRVMYVYRPNTVEPNRTDKQCLVYHI